jgi:hypothetical protein
MHLFIWEKVNIMNITKRQSNILYAVSIIALFSLQACTGYNSYSKVARAGDTISLAVGSPVGMTKDVSNTTAVYVPDAGGSYPLTIRSVFDLYPSKKSRLNLTTTVDPVVNSSDHEAWQTVMVIDLPTDLPVGTGNIVITSTAVYPPINSHINDHPIALEIISGTGSPDAFTYEFGHGLSWDGELAQLESLPHAVVTPPRNNEYYGAIEMKLSLDMSAAILNDTKVRVIVDDMNSTTLSNKSVVWHVSDTGELRVMIISPSGSLQARESRLSIISIPRVTFNSAPTLTEVNYYDVDGNLLAGAPGLSEYNVALY